ncbi:hypothetical protein BDM02DRAFT_3088436 [Thelephora ganbajun]|uniref:Uncharacterized protein n=1 Tax=Thelephora ganbajun TaxID=370292 RepID=A0ACB6ZTM0_THEGA|nr:hypothetical protein BDM02DRAFT_3088436 [Thelephora ganbajun]
MSSSLHPASLVDASLHSTATLQLVDLALTDCLIDYVTQSTVEAVDFALGRVSSSTTNPKDVYRHAGFTEFVSNVLSRSEVKAPVILVSLVYIHRAIPFLSIGTEQWARERVFLGALILAAKYTNDSTLRNVHWALCTGVFGKRDVGRIEREFLQVLNWDLSISEDDILSHHHAIYSLPGIPDSPLVATSSSNYSRSLDMEENEISSWSDSDDSCSSDSSLSPITPPLNLSGHESYSRQTASSSVTPSRPCRPVMDLGLPSALDILNSFPLPNQRCSPVSLGGKGCESQSIIPRSTRVWV